LVGRVFRVPLFFSVRPFNSLYDYPLTRESR